MTLWQLTKTRLPLSITQGPSSAGTDITSGNTSKLYVMSVGTKAISHTGIGRNGHLHLKTLRYLMGRHTAWEGMESISLMMG